MRALLLNKIGKPYDYTVGEIDTPKPGENEVRIKVAAAALNPVDWKLAQYGAEAWTEFPRVLGLDSAGVVDAVGRQVTTFAVGDRVVQHGSLISRTGGFAEYTLSDTRHLAHIPDTVSFEEAAAAMCAGVTAHQAITRKLHVAADDVVLIHGGAGGVGSFAIQICKSIGATVISTCSSSKMEIVRSIGADEVIDYTSEDVTARVMEITAGLGADRILNTLDGASGVDDLKRLAFNGNLCMIVGELPSCPEGTGMFVKGQSLAYCFLGGAHVTGHSKSLIDIGRMSNELLHLMAEGTVKAVVGKTISLEEVPVCLAELEEGHAKGKTVMTL
ncbi:Zinc-binding dehydrogenase [Carpediemonas membranifera]|uniref:Zinc-binding dehydrogenase n=1 Tax=Carpediemonas membranifera TaxID=201153 RepID=A0A8J6E6Z9_9EUKA|nr:Zinc-binding dehydrogenase [Carpediemonas membranifera]|eukprot:KAG9397687.1 Zinc-binding dehydrogenase [Carpediemonas membranifera]